MRRILAIVILGMGCMNMAFAMKCVDDPVAGCGEYPRYDYKTAARQAVENCKRVYVSKAKKCYQNKGYALTHEPYCNGPIERYGDLAICNRENVPCCYND